MSYAHAPFGHGSNSVHPMQNPPGGAYPQQTTTGSYVPNAYPPSAQPTGSHPPPGQHTGTHPPPGQPTGSHPPPGEQKLQEGAAGLNEDVENFAPSDLSGLRSFDGYGEVGFKKGQNLPPPPPSYEEASAPPTEFTSAVNISDEEARAALLEFVDEHCCYGKGAATEMIFSGNSPSSALHYSLDTFGESRITSRAEVPFFGGDTVDGPFNGPAPLPWDIPCQPIQQFTDETLKVAVPHTEEVRTCGSCTGGGYVRCRRCEGYGRNICSSCDGIGSHSEYQDGYSLRKTCYSCNGTGRTVCYTCNGNGKVVCRYCSGTGKVKAFIQLTVTYKNHLTDYIFGETDLPNSLIRSVSGLELVNQISLQVLPITTFPVESINVNSQRLVEEAKQSYTLERQLNQRQILRAVPVSEMSYTFKEISSRFWVYGMERRVYSPDYPQQCCCGCTIL